VIGAPSSAGAYGPGQERTPGVFRKHGLISKLKARGIDVIDRGDGAIACWQADEANPTARNAGPVAGVALELAEAVASALADDHNVLVLGGDCSIELGTVAGAIRTGAGVGLAYIDVDADLNTTETGDGIFDWMGVAHLLDVPGADDRLSSLGPYRPMLKPDAVRLLAVDNITGPERRLIDRLGIGSETLASTLTDPSAVAARTRPWAKTFDCLLVHLDVDVLDNDQFPIAENTRRRPGLDLPSLAGLVSDLCALPNWRALTLTEINPDHAPDERQSFQQLIALLCDALEPRSTSPT
jgi:arginase